MGIALLALVFGVMATLLFTRGGPAISEAARSGPLVVDSEPRGVEVQFIGEGAAELNQRYGGRSTPFTIREGIVIGTPIVAKFSKEGFLGLERELPPLETDVRPEPLFVELKKKAKEDAMGTLILFSKPRGARVKIDGAYVAGETPLNNVYVKAKALHQIEFELTGFSKRIETVMVDAGSQKVLDVELTPDPNAQQASAATQTQNTAASVQPVPSQPTPSESAATAASEKKTNLPRLPAKGYLNLDSNVAVDVKLGGRFLGATPIEKLALKAGKHKLRLESEAEGFYFFKGVHIRSGRTSSVDVQLGKGKLATNAKPWAKVRVGNASGKDTPARFELFEGTYQVQFECPNKEIMARKVAIKPGSTSSLSVDCNASTP